MNVMDSHLQIRLKNCLQTILELEPDLDILAGRIDFRVEMDALKGCLTEIDQMELGEEDVLRLERATAHFLKELRLPLHHAQQENAKARVLQ